jgi:hypothetical protein
MKRLQPPLRDFGGERRGADSRPVRPSQNWTKKIQTGHD